MTTRRMIDKVRRFLAGGLAVLITPPAWLSLYARAAAPMAVPVSVPQIESRLQAAETPTLLVTTLSDANNLTCGTNCSLRDAINVANSRAGDDVIGFASGVEGVIRLATALPAISTNVQI